MKRMRYLCTELINLRVVIQSKLKAPWWEDVYDPYSKNMHMEEWPNIDPFFIVPCTRKTGARSNINGQFLTAGIQYF